MPIVTIHVSIRTSIHISIYLSVHSSMARVHRHVGLHWSQTSSSTSLSYCPVFSLIDCPNKQPVGVQSDSSITYVPHDASRHMKAVHWINPSSHTHPNQHYNLCHNHPPFRWVGGSAGQSNPTGTGQFQTQITRCISAVPRSPIPSRGLISILKPFGTKFRSDDVAVAIRCRTCLRKARMVVCTIKRRPMAALSGIKRPMAAWLLKCCFEQQTSQRSPWAGQRA